MDNGVRSSTDIWRKLDVLGKLISGVLLLTISIVIGCSAERVSSALKKGQLVQSLIGDLSQNEQRVRQDIALLALDRFIDEEDSPLVVRIAEAVLRRREIEAGDGLVGDVAVDILKRRAPERARKFEMQQSRLVNLDDVHFYYDEPNQDGMWEVFKPGSTPERFWLGARVRSVLGNVRIKAMRIKPKDESETREFGQFCVGYPAQSPATGFLLQWRGRQEAGEMLAIPVEVTDWEWARNAFSNGAVLELMGAGDVLLARSEPLILSFP